MEHQGSVGRLIGTRALTKDLLFFLTFIFQVVVLFVFFWQKRQNVRRFFLGEHSSEENDSAEGEAEPSSASEDSNMTVDPKTTISEPNQATMPLKGNKEKSPEEQELDAEFQPIAATILELKKKIKGLEGTLARRKGHYGTDSLKIRLHDCISEISSTLSEIGTIQTATGSDAATIAAATNVSPNTSKIDILNWDKPDMRQNLSWIEEKRRELEAAAVLAAEQASTVVDDPKLSQTAVKIVSPRQDLEEAPQRADETSRITPHAAVEVEDPTDSESDGEKSDADEEDEAQSKVRTVLFPLPLLLGSFSGLSCSNIHYVFCLIIVVERGFFFVAQASRGRRR